MKRKAKKTMKKTIKKTAISEKAVKAPIEEPLIYEIKSELAPVKKTRNWWLVIAPILAVVILVFAYLMVDNTMGWGNPEKVIKKAIDAAEKSVVYKKYDDAIRIYDKIINRYKTNEKYGEYVKQARINLAKTYQDANEYPKAIILYTELINEYKDANDDMYAWLLLELGESNANILNTTEAIKTYEKVIKKFANTDWAAEALFGIADAYRAGGYNKNAIKYYEEIVAKYKKGFLSAEALTNIGQIYEKEGKTKQALATYNKIVKEFPEVVTEYAKIRYESLSAKIKSK